MSNMQLFPRIADCVLDEWYDEAVRHLQQPKMTAIERQFSHRILFLVTEMKWNNAERVGKDGERK